jgi:hypothetical protein
MYGRSRIESVWLRTSLAVHGQDVRPITMMMMNSDCPSRAASTIANASHGMTRNQSVKRIRAMSMTPPR